MYLGINLSVPGAATIGGTANPRFAIDATGAQIRAAIADINLWGYSPHNLIVRSEELDNAS